MASGETTMPLGGDDAPITDAAALAVLTAELREALAPGLMLLEKLGEGGMGLVFLARDPALKRLVVVKVLAPWLAADEKARARFAREAESAAAVAHPNVVGIFQVGQLPRSGTSYFVMQHVDGPTLEQAFPPGTIAALPRARRIVGEVAAALAAAHARGVVHRDIKPSNVMLDQSTGRALVLDFGISAASASKPGPAATRLTAQGSSIGTPQYMSPEQAVGEDVTDRSDIYSLGVVAFELAAGRPVFEESAPMALIAAHINRAPPKLAEVRPDADPAFAELVDRCLAKRAADRPSAEEIARVLLPGAQAQTEWPPPGLERLHGAGAALSRRVVTLGAGVVTLMTLLYLQPAMATGAWMRGESSWFWRIAWAPAFLLDGIFLRPIECSMRQSLGGYCFEALDPAPLWLFGFMALGALLVIGAFRAVIGTRQLIARLRAGRRAGYPWPILLETGWDGGPDTADLLNLCGAFALLSPQAREDLLARRRQAGIWLLAGAALSGVLPLAWLLGALRIGDSGAWLVSPGESGVVALPLLAVLAVRQRLLHTERALSRRWRRERRTTGAGSAAPQSLIEGWLAGAANVRPPRTRIALRLAAPLAVAVALVLLAAATAVALALGTTYSAFWHQPTLRTWQTDWLDYVSSSGTASGWLRMDSLLAREIARLGPAGPDPGRIGPRPGATRAAAVRQGLRAFDDIYPDSSFARLEADTSWAWLERWSTSVEAAEAWVPGMATPSARWVATGRGRPVDLNVLRATVLALEAGDTLAARRRVRQVLVMSRLQLAYGRGVLLWSLPVQLALHRLIAEATGDSVGVAAGTELLRQLERYRFAHRAMNFPGFAMGLMSDPERPSVQGLVGRRTIAPGIRAVLADASVFGLCFNGREMLLGPSAMRTDLVAHVRALMTDLPWVAARLDSLRADADRSLRGHGGVIAAWGRGRWCFKHLDL